MLPAYVAKTNAVVELVRENRRREQMEGWRDGLWHQRQPSVSLRRANNARVVLLSNIEEQTQLLANSTQDSQPGV